MNRKINITNTTQESTNHLRQVPLFLEDRPDTHLATYAENVYVGGRKALTEGKFHDMFMAADGHELEDYTDENGKQRIAHARSIYSSSMLAYNFFHWVSPERPLTLNGTTYDKVYFEVKFPIFTKATEGRPVNRPSNMDIVLISEDCLTMLCIESKYTEYTHHQTAIFSDAYITPSCYYKGNPYIPSFIKMALRYNEQKNGYYAGVKQNVSHLIGITNVMHDDKALAWFKDNNPFIEPEVLAQISHNTEFIFTNLLYCRPEDVDDFFGDLQAEEKPYPYLLAELLFDHLQKDLDEPLLLSSFIKTYPELFAEVQSQMQKPLADYLDNRYVLTPQPHFALPEGYDTADHYLRHLVMEGAAQRYGSYRFKEDPTIIDRINLELDTIAQAGISPYFLYIWDYVRKTRETKLVGPGRGSAAGSIVNYCLQITGVDPLKYGLLFERFYNPERVHLPAIDIDIEDDELWKEISHSTTIYGPSHVMKLRVLTIIADFTRQVENTYTSDLSDIPLDDPDTLRVFQDGDTYDIFQFQSEGMQEYLRELKPDHFLELVAMNAMYRPGSMDFIPSYIRRKQGKEPITYELPVMEKYLKETFGLTIYQEQVMLLAQEIACFSPVESDNLRRALGRRSVAELAAFHKRFIDGGQKNGYHQESLERIWLHWEKNCSYFFNKSHAVCYTQLAYQDAYIKQIQL